jgi:hypothetical protein
MEKSANFVLIIKPNCILSSKYHSHNKLVCTLCCTEFSSREALLNHEAIYHSEKELPIKTVSEPEKAVIKFDITQERDLKKTVWYPFVCYADFEASTKVVDGKTIQVPNSYVIFSPDLALLLEESLSERSFFKWHFSDDPEVLMHNFIQELSTLHNSHIMRMTANARVSQLTPEAEHKYKEAKVCETVNSSLVLEQMKETM